MSISFKQGDMFGSSAEAVVNTVNCVGVMGKGVALEFKRRWPDNFRMYKRACDAGSLRPGVMLVYDRGGLIPNPPRFLINFPTKDHWRAKSKIDFIDIGLDSLLAEIKRLGISSVALPPLGCGNGGLEWVRVRPLIERKLSQMPEVDFQVYGPRGEEDPPEHISPAKVMNRQRAVFLLAIQSLSEKFGGSLDRLSLQKVAYFIQALGVVMNLKFKDSLYGPYAQPLKKTLARLEQYGLVDGYSAKDRQVHVTAKGLAEASEYQSMHPHPDFDVVRKVVSLVDGFESPYGLELLSTAHFHLSENSTLHENAISELAEREPYRRNIFNDAELGSAYARLLADGLLGRNY